MKQRMLSLLLALALLCACLPAMTPAALAATSGYCGRQNSGLAVAGTNLRWSFDEATGKLTITGSGDMTVWEPQYAYDLPEMFPKESIRSVSLPNGLTSIGANAFSYCDKLTSIELPDTVKYIGAYAFAACSNLASIKLGNGLEIVEGYAFPGCGSLESVTFPDSVTEIGEYAFSCCCRLSSVTIPASLTSIEKYAFASCDSLENVYFTGTRSEWDKIKIEGNNGPLLRARVTCLGEDPGIKPDSAEDDNSSGWGNAFKWFILDGGYRSSGQEYYAGELSEPISFGLHDMDGDGIPELIASNGHLVAASTCAYVYRFTGTGLSYLGEQGFLGYGGVYDPDSDYPGIFYKWSRQESGSGSYYYVKNGNLYKEGVLSFGFPDGNPKEPIAYTKITNDTKLYNTFYPYSTGTKELPSVEMKTANEIRAMGWENFIAPFVTIGKSGFYDVPDTAYYSDAVLWAVENNITNGIDKTHFGPDRGCTRGQVVTFLWRAAGCPKPKDDKNPFTDVKKGAFYYNAVLWAVDQGITNGTSQTTFAPDATCTRGQIVTFLWRAKGSSRAVTVKNPFRDVSKKGFYYPAMLWAVENGVTTGTSKTTFAPNDTCTRGQVVTFLYRSMQKK